MSNLIPTSSFMKDISPRCPGADEVFLQQEIDAAIRELCEDGWAWPTLFGPLSLREKQRRVYLDPMPDNTRVAYVHAALFATDATNYRRVLVPLATPPASQDQEQSNEPFSYWLEDPGTMLLNPVPLKAYEKALKVYATLMPQECANPCVPEFFRTHWREAVISGVMSRMQDMNGKPWGSNSKAAINGRRFKAHKSRARDITRRQWGFGKETWQFPYYASGQPFNTVWTGGSYW